MAKLIKRNTISHDKGLTLQMKQASNQEQQPTKLLTKK
jgi:hypothetical protein